MKRVNWITIAFIIALSVPAYADTAGTAAPTWTLAEVMALLALVIASVGAIVDAVRAVLHFTAPRTKTTLDDRAAAALDGIHDRLVKVEALAQTMTPPPAVKPLAPLAVLLVAIGLGMATPACAGSTQASRASTISSLDTGIQSATAALGSYEHQRTESIIAAATDLATARAAIAAFRARVDKVWIAVNAARAAIDAANTINDDTSVAGAKTALTNAIAAVTALTGGTP